jgi:hypothetical protein
MDRVYHIVGWKIRTLLQILVPKAGTIVAYVDGGEKSYMHSKVDNEVGEDDDDNKKVKSDIKKAKNISKLVNEGRSRERKRKEQI